jgi:hypothetical protein
MTDRDSAAKFAAGGTLPPTAYTANQENSPCKMNSTSLSLMTSKRTLPWNSNVQETDGE